MGLFSKKETVIDYLNQNIDKEFIKTVLGEEINEIKFMRLALYIVSTYIASAIASSEFKVYENNKTIEDIVYYKLNISPNPNDTATRLKYNMIKKLILNGESLVVLHKNRLYFTDNFNISKKSIDGFEFTDVSIQENYLNKKFTQQTSFYFKLDDENAKSILNEIDSKYSELLSTATKAYKKAINNKWKIKIDSIQHNTPNFAEEFNKYIEEQLKTFLNGDSGVFPELNGYHLEHINLGDSSNTDSTDIHNLKKGIFEITAQAFKLPPSMMYGNIPNLKEAINQFIAFAVKPIAKLVGEEITRTFYTEEEIIKQKKKVIVDISTINYRDIFDAAVGLDKLIAGGIATIDEVRSLVNLPELDTDFSNQYWMTKNYTKIEKVMSEKNLDNNSVLLKGGDVDE